MLGYAQGRPAVAARRSSPNILLVVIVVHVALIALVMSARMDLPARFKEPPLTVDLIPEPAPPPRTPSDPQPPKPHQSTVYRQQPTVPTPPTSGEVADSTPVPMPGGEIVGADPQPRVDPVPTPAPIRLAAQLLTSGAELKPPYPASKLLTEQEADLRLKLTIDTSGHVIAVEPVGNADPVFLAAARRHLLAHWRFRPASEGGRPVASTMLITLRFQLD